MKRVLFCVFLITLSINQTIAQDTICKIFITSSPDRAKLYIDGQLTGKTPTLLELPYGEHHIKAVRGGRKAEKDLLVSNTSHSDSSFYQQIVHLDCKRRNFSYEEYIKDGTLIVTSGFLGGMYGGPSEWIEGLEGITLKLAYIKKIGGFIKLLENEGVPLINGIAIGPMIHLFGPICLETGVGYSSSSYFNTHFYFTFGSTVVFRGFSIAVSYDYCPNSFFDTHCFNLGFGWAFKPNIDFKH